MVCWKTLDSRDDISMTVLGLGNHVRIGTINEARSSPGGCHLKIFLGQKVFTIAAKLTSILTASVMLTRQR